MACADTDRGSDELTEMYCEHCDKDGISVTADGFCVDCADYMCSTCLRYHTKYVPSHTQQDKTSMPQDLCLIKCSTHPKELLKFYCSTCDATTCQECRHINHQACFNVGHIPMLVQSGEHLNELKALNITLKTLSTEADAIKQIVESNIEELSLNRREVFVSISKQQKDINEKLEDEIKKIVQDLAAERIEVIRKLDEKQSQRTQELRAKQKQLIKKMSEEAEQMTQQSKTEESKVLNIASNNDRIISDIAALKSDIERNISQKCQQFIITKKSIHDANRLNKEMHKVRVESEFRSYEFTPGTNINIASLAATASLGYLRCKSVKVLGSENSESEFGQFHGSSAHGSVSDTKLQQKFVLSEEELGLGYHGYWSQRTKITNKTILKHVDIHKIMFINRSKVAREALEMNMHKYCATVIWPEKEGVVLLQMIGGGNVRAKRLWRECAVVFNDLMENISVFRLPVDQVVWPMVKKQLCNVSIDNPDEVIVLFTQKDGNVTVTGCKIAAESVYTIVDDIIKKVVAEHVFKDLI